MEPSPADPGLALLPLLQRAGSVIESEIRGGSMGMTLPAGSRIRIRCQPPESAACGSVVALRLGQGLVGHRLLWRGADRRGRVMVVTRGDGTVICDPPAELKMVLGEVTGWHDGHDWRPLPAGPPVGLGRRAVAAAVQLLVRGLLAVHPPLAGWTAELLFRMARRLSPRLGGAPAAPFRA